MSPGAPTAEEPSTLAPGLYLVGTPIGNLEDITLRALRILKEADVIAVEDTPDSEVAAPLRHQNENRELPRAQRDDARRRTRYRSRTWSRVALVTDAGMPAFPTRISADFPRHPPPHIGRPHSRRISIFVSSCRQRPPHRLFPLQRIPPAKSGQRRQLLESIRESPRTQVFYEAPHRILEHSMACIATLGPDRHVVVAREVTELHEEFLRGRASEVLTQLKSRDTVKGEITLLLGRAEESSQPDSPRVTVRQRIAQIIADEKLDEKAALKKIAKERGISKSEAYRELQRGS